MVSKVADRSRRIRNVTSFVTFSRAVSVLCAGLYADWFGESKECVFRYSKSCFRMTFSKIFERKDRLETGR